jgi:hypothetical protein
MATGSRGKTIGIVLGGAFTLVIGFALVWGMLIGFDAEPSAVDRGRLVTVADLDLVDFEPDPAAASFTRTNYVDGTHILEYEYDSDTLYVYSSLTHENTTHDARQAYTMQNAGVNLMLHFEEGVELVERNELARWGDQSSTQVYVSAGEEVGYYVNARKGSDVCGLVIVGVEFETGGLQRIVTTTFDRATDG